MRSKEFQIMFRRVLVLPSNVVEEDNEQKTKWNSFFKVWTWTNPLIQKVKFQRKKILYI